MAPDKSTALWVSHSRICDFLNCPRLYYLNNVYKDPKTGHRINLMNPSLALGQAVHNVIESLSALSVDDRFKEPLIDKYDRVWQKVSGKKGGFLDDSIEQKYKQRGREMLLRLQRNPGPLANLAVKINKDFIYFWLSEQNNIALTGKIDWLEYLPAEDAVGIIDFKTGKNDEEDDSLQLPIYQLLTHYTQKRPVKKVSYWYLDREDGFVEKELSDLEQAQERVLNIALKIKLAQQFDKLTCPTDGCRYCQPLEKVIKGEAEFVGVNDFNQDLYVLPKKSELEDQSIIL